MTQDTVTHELHPKAKSAAHKLGGSLGGFGFPNGSKIAKQIENLLEHHLVEVEIQELTTLVASLGDELQHQPFEAKVRAALSNKIALLIIVCDRQYSQQLVTEAHDKGMQTQTAFSLEEAKSYYRPTNYPQ